MLKEGRRTDWSYITAASEAHNVSARLFARAIDLSLPEESSRKMAAAKKAIIAAMQEHAARKSELITIVSNLSSHGIHCMLLKGLSLDRSMLRRSGDIDILVEPDRLLDAIETTLSVPGHLYAESPSGRNGGAWTYHGILTAGIRARIRQATKWKHEFHVYNPKRDILLEFHVNIFPRAHRSAFRVENLDSLWDGIDRIWKSGRVNPELGCKTPCIEHSLLLMCLHNALKRSPANNRFRLSTLVDIDALASSTTDWDAFLEECDGLKVFPFVYFSLRLAKKLLDAPVPDRVLARLKTGCTGLQLALVRIHLRCVSSLYSSSFLYRGLYQALGPFAFGGSLAARLRGAMFMPLWLPPPSKAIETRNAGGGSLHTVCIYLLDPFRRLFLIIQKVALKEARLLFDSHST